MQRGLFQTTKNHPMEALRNYSSMSWVSICLIALLSFLNSGCKETYKSTLERLDRVVVAPPTNEKVVKVDFCTDPAVPEKTAVKMVVILDHSSSNKVNYQMAPDGSGSPFIVNNNIQISPNLGTDPAGTLRYGNLITPGSLIHYLNDLPPNDPADPSKYFALINFSTSAYTYPAGSSGFTGDIPAFYNQVLTQARGGDPNNLNGVPADTGSTNYIGALQETYKIITADIAAAKRCAALAPTTAPTINCPTPGRARTSAYVVVMATDGAPIMDVSGFTNTGAVTGPVNVTRQSTNEILGAVQNLIALTSDRRYVAGVNLFTVHYVNPLNNVDQTARTLLAEMARVGNGIPYVSTTGSSIDYTRFQPPQRLVKYLLSDLFVSNTSGVWNRQGAFVADQDGDGISDADELAWGSVPTLWDSNNNGVNDRVEQELRRGAACNAKNAAGVCQDPAVNYRVNSAAPCFTVPFTGGRYRASDPNGLNDCEKILLTNNGGINNPDSNADGIPDWLSFKNKVPFQLGTAPSYLSTLSDGYTQYQKVKLSMPQELPITMLVGYRLTNYALTQVSTNSSQTCYQLRTTQLPLLGNSDRIRVEVIQRSELLQDRFLYRTAQKNFVPGQNVLQFNDWNDPIEKAAGTWGMWP